jgi:hypothetical protein
MTPIRIEDFYQMGKLRTSPRLLREKIGKLVLGSTVIRAKVETLDAGTGIYRVVLQGTLDNEIAPELGR